METLVSLLDENRDSICRSLQLCKDNWTALLRICDSGLLASRGKLNNEETWTFLAACGYAIDGPGRVALLTEILTGRSGLPLPEPPKVWLEYRPVTPRRGEGRTHLDLAVGNIIAEAGTKGGIELVSEGLTKTWICFCEMKWESDISPWTTNDENRNQLVRVIESALYFQKAGIFADEVYVSLVTPEAFKADQSSEKLYQRKFAEYECSYLNILEDLNNCRLPSRNQFDAGDRIDALSLRWPTYDDLFNGLPASAVSNRLREFWSRYGNYLKE